MSDFRKHAGSGLLVPGELERKREVLTRDEWRLLERCTKMLNGHNISISLECMADTCNRKPFEPTRLPDGTFRLRCACTDFVMDRTSHRGSTAWLRR